MSRLRWTSSHLTIAGLGALLLLLAFATAMALTAGQAVGGTGHLLVEIMGAAPAGYPAVLVIMAAVLLVFALVPHWSVVISWLLLAASILLSPVFGASLRLPQWATDLSPFAHQMAPAREVDVPALAVLLAVAAIVSAAGLAAFRRRDISAG